MAETPGLPIITSSSNWAASTPGRPRRLTASDRELDFFLLFLHLYLILLERIHISRMSEQLAYKGSLAGHTGDVTAIATSSENPDMILTSSRGECLV